jgi:hypothetical protein
MISLIEPTMVNMTRVAHYKNGWKPMQHLNDPLNAEMKVYYDVFITEMVRISRAEASICAGAGPIDPVDRQLCGLK